MQQLQERTFEHKGESFKLKLFGTDHGFTVVAFLKEQQASPSYSVDFVTHTDYFIQHQASLTENLFGLAQSDIEKGMYFRA